METFLFDKFAENEDRHWWFRGRREVLLSVARRFLPSRDRVRILDVGCGTGFMMEALGALGDVEGLESSPEARAYCRRRLGPNVVLHEGALPNGLPQDRRFDLITAFDVLEHLEDPVTSLRAIRDRLPADGVFIATVPAFMFLWSRHDEVNHHFRRYDRALLSDQLQTSGFRPLFTSYFNTALFPAIAAVRVASRLFPGSGSVPGSDMEAPPSLLLNRALEKLFAAERNIVGRRSLPFGVSLLAVARRS